MTDNPVLIIGCGYLGRRAAARWREQGRRVLATTRGRGEELRSWGIEPIVADVRHADWPELPAATVVYAVGFDRAAGTSMREIYVDGLANVLAKLPRGGRFLYVSSTGVYGDAGGEWVDEDTPPAPADESGRIVRDAEILLQRERPEAIRLRFAGIYGPGRLLREAAIRAGEPIATDPHQWLNLIHVDDGAAVILAAEERAEPGTIYNVSDGQPVSRGDFYRQLAHRLAAAPPRFIPPPPGADRGNRRICNRRLIQRLGVSLLYPSYTAGLTASITPSE